MTTAIGDAKKSVLLLALLLLASLFIAPNSWAQDEPKAEQPKAEELDADAIIERAVERNALGFESGRATVILSVYDRGGERRERHLDVRSKRIDGQARTLMTLTEPAEVRGQAFLFAENKEGADDMWMYVPAFKVTRRVEGSQKRSSFLGSHFTFADLESRDLRQASYTRKDDESIGDNPVFVIEARSKHPEDSDYGRIVAYIRQSDFLPLRVRFFDKNNSLLKTLFSERINKTDAGATFVEQMTLRAEEGGYTTIRIPSLDTTAELPDAIFSRDELGR